MAYGAEFTILQFLYIGGPRDLVFVLPSLNIPCKVYTSVLVMFCWFQLTKRVDMSQSWWKTNLNSWSVRRVFVWRRHLFSAWLKLRWCTFSVCIIFKNTAKYRHENCSPNLVPVAKDPGSDSPPSWLAQTFASWSFLQWVSCKKRHLFYFLTSWKLSAFSLSLKPFTLIEQTL